MPTKAEFIKFCKECGFADDVIERAMKSKFLNHITATKNDNGELDIPWRDWSNAVFDAMGMDDKIELD